MKKPTYYLWRNDFSTQEEFETEKERLSILGFLVFRYLDKKKKKKIKKEKKK